MESGDRAGGGKPGKRWQRVVLSAMLTLLVVPAVAWFARGDLHALADWNLAWGSFLAVLPFYVLAVVARGARLKLILRTRGSLATCSSISAIHVMMTKVLPFMTGELTLPLLLKRQGIAGYLVGSGVLVGLRFIDFLVLFASLFLSALLARPDYLSEFGLHVAAGFVLCLAGFGVVVALLLRLLPSPAWVRRWLPEAREVVPGAGGTRGDLVRILAGCTGLTAVAWTVVFVSYAALLPWAGVAGLTPAQAVLACTAASAAGLLPVNTFLSLGTWEAGWAASLYLVGVDPSFGVVVGFRMHVAMFVFNAAYALMGLWVLGRKPGQGGAAGTGAGA